MNNEITGLEDLVTEHFVMCRMDNSQPIGTISLMHVDEVNGNAGVGISIGEKSLWGKG